MTRPKSAPPAPQTTPVTRAQLIESAYDAGLLIPQDSRLPSILGMPAIVERPESDPFPVVQLLYHTHMSNDEFANAFAKPAELKLLYAFEAEEAANNETRNTPDPSPSTFDGDTVFVRDGIIVCIDMPRGPKLTPQEMLDALADITQLHNCNQRSKMDDD